LKAKDIDGYLTAADRENLVRVKEMYDRIAKSFSPPDSGEPEERRGREAGTVSLYGEMGQAMREICMGVPGVNVCGFRDPPESRPEVSRIVAKLRDVRTGRGEFVYYIQRAYETLFGFALGGDGGPDGKRLIVETPVGGPTRNFAVHKIPGTDGETGNAVMCVMLRGALLPSMVVGKEITEHSPDGRVTPFALFSVRRADAKKESDMEYVLDLDRSYFRPEALDGRDLIFADPVNATGGSLVTTVKYLLGAGIRPRSIRFLNVIAALKGTLRVARALENCEIYTLWMDPALNDLAYIVPGLGDAGDRISGKDADGPGNVIRLLAGLGDGVAGLYRPQLREIEETVLSRRYG